MTENKGVSTALKARNPNAACPRRRFFAETRKGDDGDRPRGFGGPQGPPIVRVHRRGALTPYRRAAMRRGRVAPPVPPGSERRLESFMNNAGLGMRKLLLLAASLCLIAAAPAPPAGKPAAYDLLFTGGRVVDGTGAPWFA